MILNFNIHFPVSKVPFHVFDQLKNEIQTGSTKLCHNPPRPTTIHHDPPPSTTTHHHPAPSSTSQNISTTTHHQPKYIHHYLPFPKKMDHHPAKAKIYSYTSSFRHCFNSFFFFPSVTDILSDEVLINSFFKFQITTTFSTFYDI